MLYPVFKIPCATCLYCVILVSKYSCRASNTISSETLAIHNIRDGWMEALNGPWLSYPIQFCLC